MATTQHQPLPSMMADLAQKKVTGALVATSEGSTREILFTRGEIRAARSQLEAEKLGMWLVSREKINEDDRALILLAQGGGNSPPLGHILVTRGYITHEELEKELEELALTIIRRAAAAKDATSEFVDGGGEGQLDTLPNVITSQIIVLTAREVSDVEAVRAVIGSSDQTVKLSGSLNDMLEEVELTPTEGFLLSRLDAAHDVASLIQLSSLPEDQAYTTLYTLLMSGVVVVGDGGEKASPQEPAGEAASDRKEDQPPETETPGQGDFSERQLEERRYIRKLSDDITKVDHYRALGLKRNAKPNEILDVWTKTQNRFSPETSGAHLKDMASHLERIVERGRAAFEVLSDFRTRHRYDEILKSLDQDRRPMEDIEKAGVDSKARRALVEANIKRADELIKEDELYLAIQLLEQACAIEPRPDELLKLAKLLQRNPLWVNRALSCMRRAIEANPKHLESWLELANFWRRRNHSERQRKSLERALAINPDNKRAKQMYKNLAGSRELQRLLRRARQAQ
jgi:tetratricopeptide (TPR) repeat protein